MKEKYIKIKKRSIWKKLFMDILTTNVSALVFLFVAKICDYKVDRRNVYQIFMYFNLLAVIFWLLEAIWD